MEEAGELSQVIGKARCLNGESEETELEKEELKERLASELLDVAQVAVSMMFVLEDEYGVDIEDAVKKHKDKLKKKGYVK